MTVTVKARHDARSADIGSPGSDVRNLRLEGEHVGPGGARQDLRASDWARSLPPALPPSARDEYARGDGPPEVLLPSLGIRGRSSRAAPERVERALRACAGAGARGDGDGLPGAGSEARPAGGLEG